MSQAFIELTARPASPRAARDLVRHAADRAHWSGDVDAAVLGASEIVTNALQHTGSVGELHVVISESRLRVEAEDFGAGEPHVCAPAATDLGGRGLAIVECLSFAWGVTSRGGSGKTVWFEIDGAA